MRTRKFVLLATLFAFSFLATAAWRWPRVQGRGEPPGDGRDHDAADLRDGGIVGWIIAFPVSSLAVVISAR